EGRPPFHRPTAMEAAYAIAVDPPEPMKRAGPLEPLISALLSKEPDERPSAEETEQALRAARAARSTRSSGATAPTADGRSSGSLDSRAEMSGSNGPARFIGS